MIPDYLDIPLFPLPNVTFFTHTFLPLHIFEPRYRKMTEACLAGDRMMGVALLRVGWQKDYFGQPPIFRTFGVGKIIDVDRAPDGTFNIVLEGLYRVRMTEEFPSRDYRVARAEVLHEWPIDAHREKLAPMMKELREGTDLLGRVVPHMREPLQTAWSAHPHPLVILNHLAAVLAHDTYDRQSILEQDDPLRRMQLVIIQLRAILAQAQSRELREEVVEED